MPIKIGADPEVFLLNPNSGKFISAHNLVPGTKKKPFKVNFGAVQLDGTAAEFNIDPASSVEEFSRNINQVMQTLREMVPGYHLSATPSVVYEDNYFKYGIPKSAKLLGCDPDFNAWTLSANDTPNAATTLRTGAGHIHIGWTEGVDTLDADHFMKCAAVARQMDYYLGIWSLLWDKDPTRRTLYGKAGAFRAKPYGVEYRVLSNKWLSSQILINWIYEAAMRAMRAFEADGELSVHYGDTARNIIDNNETDWTSKYELDIDVPPLPSALFQKAA